MDKYIGLYVPKGGGVYCLVISSGGGDCSSCELIMRSRVIPNNIITVYMKQLENTFKRKVVKCKNCNDGVCYKLTGEDLDWIKEWLPPTYGSDGME